MILYRLIKKVDRFVGKYPRAVFIVGMILFILMVVFTLTSCQTATNSQSWELRTKLSREMKWSGVAVEGQGKNLFKYVAIVPNKDGEYYCSGILKYENGKITVLTIEKMN